MSLDELVYQIQHGHEDLIPELWNEVKGLIRYFAISFCRQWDCSKFGIELDDLVQEGYFAMLDTLRKHDPEKGSFNTLFAYDLRRRFQDAIGRTGRKRGDLLNHCLSLDAEIDPSECNGDSLYELVPDGYDYTGPVEQKIYIQQLHEELEKILSSIPADEAEVIKAVYYENKTLAEIADSQSQTRENVRQRKDRGLRNIRKSKYIRELERFIDLETNFYKKVSVDSFNATHTSAVEAIVLERERMLREMINLSISDPELAAQKWREFRNRKEQRDSLYQE